MARRAENLHASLTQEASQPSVASGFRTGQSRCRRGWELQGPREGLTCGFRPGAGCVLSGCAGWKLEGVQRCVATLGVAAT